MRDIKELQLVKANEVTSLHPTFIYKDPIASKAENLDVLYIVKEVNVPQSISAIISGDILNKLIPGKAAEYVYFYDEDKSRYLLGSKIIPNFKGVDVSDGVPFSIFGYRGKYNPLTQKCIPYGCIVEKGGNVVGRMSSEAPSLFEGKPLVGDEEVMVACDFIGEPDLDYGNLGTIEQEDAYHVAKVDHDLSLKNFNSDIFLNNLLSNENGNENANEKWLFNYVPLTEGLDKVNLLDIREIDQTVDQAIEQAKEFFADENGNLAVGCIMKGDRYACIEDKFRSYKLESKEDFRYYLKEGFRRRKANMALILDQLIIEKAIGDNELEKAKTIIVSRKNLGSFESFFDSGWKCTVHELARKYGRWDLLNWLQENNIIESDESISNFRMKSNFIWDNYPSVGSGFLPVYVEGGLNQTIEGNHFTLKLEGGALINNSSENWPGSLLGFTRDNTYLIVEVDGRAIVGTQFILEDYKQASFPVTISDKLYIIAIEVAKHEGTEVIVKWSVMVKNGDNSFDEVTEKTVIENMQDFPNHLKYYPVKFNGCSLGQVGYFPELENGRISVKLDKGFSKGKVIAEEVFSFESDKAKDLGLANAGADVVLCVDDREVSRMSLKDLALLAGRDHESFDTQIVTIGKEPFIVRYNLYFSFWTPFVEVSLQVRKPLLLKGCLPLPSAKEESIDDFKLKFFPIHCNTNRSEIDGKQFKVELSKAFQLMDYDDNKQWQESLKEIGEHMLWYVHTRAQYCYN